MRVFKELTNHPVLTVLIVLALLTATFAALHRPQSEADRLLSSCWEGSVIGGDHQIPCSQLPPDQRPQFMDQP
jgi:hypothetical protein